MHKNYYAIHNFTHFKSQLFVVVALLKEQNLCTILEFVHLYTSWICSSLCVDYYVDFMNDFIFYYTYIFLS